MIVAGKVSVSRRFLPLLLGIDFQLRYDVLFGR